MRALIDQGALCGGSGIHDPVRAEHDKLSTPGRDLDYQLTEAGQALLERLEVDIPQTRRRLIAYCVDWTEQSHHLGGALGAALLTRIEVLGWVRRGERGAPRAVAITPTGADGFAEVFGIDTTTLATPTQPQQAQRARPR